MMVPVLRRLGMYKRMILMWTLKKEDERAWTGLILMWIAACDGHLWTVKGTLLFLKMWEIP